MFHHGETNFLRLLGNSLAGLDQPSRHLLPQICRSKHYKSVDKNSANIPIEKPQICRQVMYFAESDLSRDTFADYVRALEQLFVIRNIEAWCPAIRSKTAIRSSVKRGFCDPSIAVALLGLFPSDLEMQLKTFGFIFEQMG